MSGSRSRPMISAPESISAPVSVPSPGPSSTQRSPGESSVAWAMPRTVTSEIKKFCE
jgi:hypothetical protein